MRTLLSQLWTGLVALYAVVNLLAAVAGRSVSAAGFSDHAARRVRWVCGVLDWVPLGPVGSILTLVVCVPIAAVRLLRMDAADLLALEGTE